MTSYNESILPLLTRWNEIIQILRQTSVPSDVNYYNSHYNLELMIELCNHIKSVLPTIYDWSFSYLSAHRKSAWIRSMLACGQYFVKRALWNQTLDGQPPPQFLDDWNAMFYGRAEVFTCDIDFRVAYDIVVSAISHMDYEYCDDPNILEIHKEKPCTGDGCFCDLCETAADAWVKKIREDVGAINNIFLNPSLTDAFINTFMNASEFVVPNDWVPIYGANYYFSHEPNDIYWRDIFYSCISCSRVDYGVAGLTPFQAMNAQRSTLRHNLQYPYFFDCAQSLNADAIVLCMIPYVNKLTQFIDVHLENCRSAMACAGITS